MSDITERLTTYLVDAHSIEEQSLQQMEKAPDIAGEPEFARVLREHLTETREHEQRIRTLLEQRDASPSRIKDAVMRAGGEGFVLFARSQTDTPGKLASHALSYEAMEWAAYDILARTAERAGEQEVARVAREIRDQERAMMQRIESLFDRTVAASLEQVPRDDMEEQLRKYLADAHAIEAQAIQLLEAGPEMVDQPTLSRLFEEHLAETRRQQQRVEQRLDALDGEPSKLKDAALRMGALNWGMFFQAQPDTPPKLAGFAYAFEHLEIGGYEQLKRVAERVGDPNTARMARDILAEERSAADRIAGAFDEALDASLAGRTG